MNDVTSEKWGCCACCVGAAPCPGAHDKPCERHLTIPWEQTIAGQREREKGSSHG